MKKPMQQNSGKKGEFERFIAIFMSILIITLPIYTANVFAAITFQEVHISGGDGKESFRKENDATTIRVKINSPTPVLPTFLEVMNESRGVTRNSPGTVRFSQCTTVNPYECSVTLPINKVDDKDRYSVCVNLANVEGRADFPQSCEAARPVAQQAGNQYSFFPSILVDKRGPTVERFSAEPTGVSGGDVGLTTTVVDTTGTAAPGCVGLAKIKFFKEDGETLAENVSEAPPSTSACPANTTTFHFNADTLPNGASTKICAVPEDTFGNRHPSYVDAEGTLIPTLQNCLNITKDNRPPEIPAENFTIMDANMVNTLTFVADRVLDVKIIAMVRTHTHLLAGANASTVSFKTGDANITLACAIVPELRDETTDHVYKCIGTAQLNPDGEKTRSLSLAVADTAKNYAEATTSISFQIDDVPPVVREITATRVFGGVPIIGPASNTLIAVIDETGAGISKETVLINNKQPEACIQPEAGAYLCNITLGSVDSDTVSILVRGKDLADNTMEQGTADILVDKDAPLFVKAQIISPSKTPVLPAGGTAILRLIVQEKFAMADDAGVHNAIAKIPFDAENPSAFKPAASCQPFAPVAASAPPSSAPPSSPPPAAQPPAADAPPAGGPTFDAGTGALVAVTGQPVNENLPNLWQCDWEIFNLKPNADFRAITFTGTKDIAGNTLVRDGQSVIVVEDPFLVYTDTLGNVHELHSSDWLGQVEREGLPAVKYTITPYLTSPVIDARGAAVRGPPIFFELAIQPVAGTSSDVQPAAVDVKQCSSDDYTAGFFAQENTKIMFSTRTPTTALLRFGLRTGAIPEDKKQFTVACDIAIISRNTKTHQVSGSVTVPITLTIPLGNVQSLSDGVWNEIIDKMDESFYLADWVGTANKVLTFLQSICGVLQALAGISTAIAGVQAALTVASDVFPLLEPAAVAMTQVSSFVNKFTNIFESEIGTQACQFLTCEWPSSGALLKALGIDLPSFDQSGVGKFLKGVAKDAKAVDPEHRSEFDFNAFANPRSSLWLSVVSLCLPGILENLNKRRVVECSYIGCLYNNVAAGLPKASCDKVYRYETCKLTVGEITYLVPYAHMLKQFGAIIKQLTTQPTLVFVVTGAVYCEVTTDKHVKATCNILYVPIRLMQAINNIKLVWNTIESMFDLPDDACTPLFDKIKQDPRYDTAKERRSSAQQPALVTPRAPQLPALPPAEGEVELFP